VPNINETNKVRHIQNMDKMNPKCCVACTSHICFGVHNTKDEIIDKTPEILLGNNDFFRAMFCKTLT
jgi:hypothetical protein